MPDYLRLPLDGPNPDTVMAVVEIPRGSRNKVEYNKELHVFELDRVLSSPMVYVADYGFLPRTLAGDGDPADVVILTNEPTFTGCYMAVRPVGMMKMEDAGEDFKILCVPAGDRRYDHIRDLGDASPFRVTEIEHFFAFYKTLDENYPVVAGWEGAEAARQYIARCAEAFPG